MAQNGPALKIVQPGIIPMKEQMEKRVLGGTQPTEAELANMPYDDLLKWALSLQDWVYILNKKYFSLAERLLERTKQVK